MHTIQVGKLKRDFSSVIEKVEKNGEKYIIEYGKKHKKVAMIIPYNKNLVDNNKRKFGQLDDKFTVPPDFNEELNEINKMFYEE